MSIQSSNATDILVDCGHPDVFDATISKLASANLVMRGTGYLRKEGHYVLRVFGDIGFVLFACENQGYAKVVRVLDALV